MTRPDQPARSNGVPTSTTSHGTASDRSLQIAYLLLSVPHRRQHVSQVFVLFEHAAHAPCGIGTGSTIAAGAELPGGTWAAP